MNDRNYFTITIHCQKEEQLPKEHAHTHFKLLGKVIPKPHVHLQPSKSAVKSNAFDRELRVSVEHAAFLHLRHLVLWERKQGKQMGIL